MNNIELINLSLKNFKGTRYFDAHLDSGQNFFRGDNGTGKTTIEDALCWLLTGKNSQGDSDTNFNIKKLDADNRPEHHAQHGVYGLFRVNETTRELKREYHEKWVKKSGAKEKVFEGHTTIYYVDTIKTTKGKYNSAVIEIMGVANDTFMMISNPLYFIKQMKWPERRAELCKIAGSVSFSDIEKGVEFKDLAINLDIHTPENYKKHCKDNRSNITDQLAGLPHEIKALNEMKDSIEAIDFEVVELELKGLNSDLEEKKIEKESLNIEDVILKLTNEHKKNNNKLNSNIHDVNSEISRVKGEKLKHVDSMGWLIDKRANLKSVELDSVKEKELDLKGDIFSSKKSLSSETSILAMGGADIARLRVNFSEVTAKVFEHNPLGTCLTCSKPYTLEEVHEEKENARKAFDEGKASKLAGINEQGKKLKDIESSCETKIATFKAQLEVMEKELLSSTEEIAKVQLELESIKSEKDDIDTKKFDDELSSLNVRHEGLSELMLNAVSDFNQERENLKSSDEGENKKVLEEEIKVIEEMITNKKEILSERGTVKKLDSKIEDIQGNEKTLNIEWNKWDKQYFLIEKLIVAYASAVEEKANNLFSVVKFKLFEIQQNGGLKEICDPMVNGVPIGDLNTASLINAGLDIINTLSKHYGVTVPVFIDNRESITNIIDTDSQIINLIKDADYKTLTQTEK